MRHTLVRPVDAIWLNTDHPANLMVIEALVLLDGPLDREHFERVVRERIVERYPVFGQRPVRPRFPGGLPRWTDAAPFRFADHVREATLEAPADDLALQAYVAQHLGRPLRRDRPLWEIHLIEGRDEGTAVFVRLHHALADGIALTRVLLSITDETSQTAAAGAGAEETSERPDGAARGAARLRPASLLTPVRVLAQGLRVGAKLLLARNPATVLSGTAESEKIVVWSAAIPLAAVKDVARSTGSTVNDVLVAALAGALHRYQAQQVHQAGPPSDVATMVPVNLRPLDRPLPVRLGNRFAVVLLRLPSSRSTTQGRLSETKRRMDAIKGSPEPLITFGVIHLIGLLGARGSRALARFFSNKASGVTTNVPGPREHRYLAGTRIGGLLGWVPSSGDQTLGTCIFTYAGAVRVGFKVDARAIPDPGLILSGFHEEIDALVGLVGPAHRASGTAQVREP